MPPQQLRFNLPALVAGEYRCMLLRAQQRRALAVNAAIVKQGQGEGAPGFRYRSHTVGRRVGGAGWACWLAA